jgi:dihydrofolate synthase/folylpolyglutamate synthase
MDPYAETIQFLYGLTRFGMTPGLETTRQLAARVGDPQQQLTFIHVAGTNGKGTTSALLESIYRASGLRVGLFTSPHLISFRERIQVNREPISKADLVRLTASQQQASDSACDSDPTLFEFVTVLAFRHFVEQKCDLVILETGLGGRLDSTNIVTPIASVITPISLDHQQYLGETLAKIAGEKAGIMKPGIPAFSAPQAPEVASVLQHRSDKIPAPLTTISSPTLRLTDQHLTKPAAPHDRMNAALAIEVVTGLSDWRTVREDAIGRGLASCHWPGRMQRIQRADRIFLIDGAHNEAGFLVLTAALPTVEFAEKPALIIGMLGDKNAGLIPQLIAKHFSAVHVVKIASERAGDPEDLINLFRATNPTLPCQRHDSIAAALTACGTNTVIAGSMYLVGEALEALDAIPAGLRSERALNEWQPKE